jgi:diguanylate cyclase (GGDEF)-like protein
VSFTHLPGLPCEGFDVAGRSRPEVLLLAADRIRHGACGRVLESLAVCASVLLDAPATVAILEDGLLVRRAVAPAEHALLGTLVDTVGTLCGQVLSSGQPVRSGDSLVDSDAGPGRGCCPGARSVLSVPLVAGGRTFGVVSATASQPDWFGEADEQTLAILAAAAADVLAERPVASRPDEPTVTGAGRVPMQAGPQRILPAGPLAGQPTELPAAQPVEPSAGTGVAGSALDGAMAGTPGIPGVGLHSLGLWQWNAADGELKCSSQVDAMLGLPIGQRVGLDIVRDLVHPDDLARFDEILLHHVGCRQPVEGQFRVVTAAGEVRHLYGWTDVRVENGRIVAAFGGVTDVSRWQVDATALDRSRTGICAARELTGMAFWEWQPASGDLTWSPEMFRLAGFVPGEIDPSLAEWHRHVHPEDLPRVRRLDVEALDRRDGLAESFRVVGADGVLRHVQAWSVPVRLPGGGLTVQGAAVDVTRQVQDRVRLDRLSATDPVTGLPNRVAFERRIIEQLADHSQDVALLLLDLDRFKLVNDSLGHQVGDRLLVEVARRLADVVPGGSLTARMGGDEFVVVPPPGYGWAQVCRLAETIVETLRRPYVLSETGDMLVCPVSVGVTATSGRDVSAEDLLSEADLALYRAKDSGRDRYVVYDDALRSRIRGRHLAEQLLRSALERGRLTLRYQPIAELRTGRVVGAEALVRIRDVAGDLVLPDTFIEVAEDTGLVVDLDCWVIETALDQLVRWGAGQRAEVPWLAVNVSARSMEHPRVVQCLLDGLRQRGLPPVSIKVELTEHSFLGTLSGSEAVLRQLISSGVPVGIDDFGTGYSALAYLQRFDLDFMKIDRSFVALVGEQDRADAVATAIVGLAHDMQVTAEGIENPVQARRLAEIGCDFAQGFHLGRPVEGFRLLG